MLAAAVRVDHEQADAGFPFVAGEDDVPAVWGVRARQITSAGTGRQTLGGATGGRGADVDAITCRARVVPAFARQPGVVGRPSTAGTGDAQRRILDRKPLVAPAVGAHGRGGEPVTGEAGWDRERPAVVRPARTTGVPGHQAARATAVRIRRIDEGVVGAAWIGSVVRDLAIRAGRARCISRRRGENDEHDRQQCRTRQGRPHQGYSQP